MAAVGFMIGRALAGAQGDRAQHFGPMTVQSVQGLIWVMLS